MTTVLYKDFPMDILDIRVFRYEPQRPNETIIACWDFPYPGGQPRASLHQQSWLRGFVLTNQAITSWEGTNGEVIRYDFDKMSAVNVKYQNEARNILEFTYDVKPVKLYLTTKDGFCEAVIDALSKVTIYKDHRETRKNKDSDISCLQILGYVSLFIVLSLACSFCGSEAFSYDQQEIAGRCVGSACGAFLIWGIIAWIIAIISAFLALIFVVWGFIKGWRIFSADTAKTTDL
ncbi:MAG: hypothetical protein KDJ52_32685 [Anaerolineae bacterium]|nr:hypothetical protein [Anaerolineae bacterium]MCB0214141.1 hypothetical protein [Anaerolineae bacterium]